MTTMTIGIVETGRMALRLVALFANQGHDAAVRKPLSPPNCAPAPQWPGPRSLSNSSTS